MNIEELKKRQDELRMKLTGEIQSFYLDTGLEPDINISFIPVNGIGESRRSIVTVDVEVRIRSK